MEMLLDSGVQDCADRLLTLLSGDNLLLEGVYGLMDGKAGLLVSLCLMPVRKDPRGDNVTTDTGSSLSTMLFAPSGSAVGFSEHIK